MAVDRKATALSVLATPAAGDLIKIVDISEPLAADKDKVVLWSTIQALAAAGATALQPADLNTLAELNALIADATLGDAGDFATAAQGAKVDFLTVTQAVDLDAIETRVNALDAAVVLKGVWDASVGTFPGGGAAQAGDSYIVSVGGTVGGVAFAINDRAIAIIDNASTTVFAANWFKADYSDAYQTDAEIKTAYQAAVPLISQAAAEAGTATGIESWSALRVAQAIAALAGGGGAFTADVNTQITPSTAIVLDQATGNEIALDLSFTVNKLTSGNYTGLKIYATETAAPGTDDRLIDVGVGVTSKFYIDNAGLVNFPGTFKSSVADGASAIAFSLDTAVAYTTAGAKLQSWKNATAEKAYIDKDGKLVLSASGVIEGLGGNTFSIGSTTVALAFGTNDIFTASNGTYTMEQAAGPTVGPNGGAGFSLHGLNQVTGVRIQGGSATSDLAPAPCEIVGGNAKNTATTNLVGAACYVTGGAGASGSAGAAHGGNVNIRGGTGYGTGHKGYIILDRDSMPTSDPTVAGALWLSSGVLTVSAG